MTLLGSHIWLKFYLIKYFITSARISMQIYIFMNTVKEIETKQGYLLLFINNSIGYSTIGLATK